MKAKLLAFRRSLTALIIGFLASAVLILCVGESPRHILQIFLNGAGGSAYDFGLTLYYAVPLVLTGLAVSIGLKTRLFNIGVEGQLTVGALAAALAGIVGPDSAPWNRLLGFGAALLAGGLWGALLGYLRARRRAHEVVAGIMLNFIAYGLTSWIALNFFKNPESQNPETMSIPTGARIPSFTFFQSAPVSWVLIIAPFAALCVWAYYRWTRAGFAMEAVGSNPEAARYAGISIATQQFWALTLGGMLSGLVGFIEVYGNTGKFVVGFSPGYGFMGVAVALVGRLNPLGILGAALLFAGLHKGSLDLDFETEWLTRDFAQILQAILILFMSCSNLIPASWQLRIEVLKRRLHGNRD
ncbi:MAG: ABC transporter permease [Chitinophagaceae bacterium]|nr:ABC transporter permease [Oligoflexus sp.]